MAKDTAIKTAIAADSYLLERKTPTAAEQQLFLKEVSFACPLCGKDLRHRKQPKSNKLYEIAHIFPNAPTDEQYATLGKLPRLGANSESYENRIAFSQLLDNDNSVKLGDKIVTSNISDKYLPGILIGYVTEVKMDANNLSKSGQIIPVVDFEHLSEVLIIMELKQTID